MNNSSMNRLFLAVGAIATGMIAGLLFSPRSGRENREWVNKNVKEASDWVDKKSREAASMSEKKVNQLSNKVSEVRKSLPDLYEATKKMTFRKS